MGFQKPGFLRIDGNARLDDYLGSPFDCLLLEPLQDRLDCDGLDLHAFILPHLDLRGQMRAFGFRRHKTPR
jgi:hypothetical protein